MPRRTLEILCRIVDNYGDAGVAWRLACILAREQRFDVTLRIDDPAVLARIAAPGEPVRVERLTSDPPPGWRAPDAIVDAFGGDLSDRWWAAIAHARPRPVFVTLEYLSAEPWIDDAHARPSPHPRHDVPRWFFFPGFSERSGGLLREHDLLAQRDAFVADAAAVDAFWNALGPPPPRSALVVSLFCYPAAPIVALLELWTRGPSPVHVVVPEGVATAAIATLAGRPVGAGERIEQGALSIVVAPFVPQPAFDRRLWASDLAIVRGEDSFVRAQWAGRPLVWHAYRQQGDAHLTKLDAFLDRYAAALPAGGAAALCAFSRAFNGGDAAALAAAWPPFAASLPALAAHAQAWCRQLEALPELGHTLARFIRNQL